MGCHTWMHKKCTEDFETIKNKVLECINKEINMNDTDFINSLQTQEDKDYWIIECERIRTWYKYLLRFFDKFSNSTIYKILENNLKDEFERSYEYDENTGNLYINLAGPNLTPIEEWFHDSFRIGNYPEDKLYSLKETLDFIKLKGNEIYKKDLISLKKFWDNHPDGMIRFG